MKCKHEGCNNEARQYSYFDKKRNTTRLINKTECQVCTTLKSCYGITGPQREEILAKQDYKCGCCKGYISFSGKRSGGKGKTEAALDHCHKTNAIRGILCGDCNTSIGKLGDNIEGLQKAINYLKQTQPT